MAQYCDNWRFAEPENDEFRWQDSDNDSFQFWNGLRGPEGPAGSGVQLRGPVATVGDLPVSAPADELWMVGTVTPFDGYFWTGSAWANLGPVAQGPQGEQGPAGQDGADGKSAYASAQDGGYTGTEQQFNSDLAEVGDKLDLSGGTMTGAINMGSHKITNLPDGTADGDAVNLGQVSGMISTNTAYFRGSFATKAALLAVAWQTSDPSAAYYVTNNDYAIVEDDETQNDECWRYVYVAGTGWAAQYKINETPLTPAQIAALNSGATSTNISAIADKLDKTGDGKDVTVTFSAPASRTAIATGEKLSVLFGKILKWLSDLGTAAFRAATSSISSGSTDLVESGAVYTGLAGKAASDLGVTGATVTQYVQITAVDGAGKPTAFGPGTPSGGGSAVNVASVTIAYANWTGSGPYTQTVTISGATITANTKVDLQPDAAAIAQMFADGVTAIYISNTSGTLTAYAVGAATTADLTIQCTYYETT